MMVVGIASANFDPAGAVIVSPGPDSELDSMSRRVSVARTLDGGVAVDDGGYAVGDREFRLVLSFPPREVVDRLRYLLQTYQRVTATTHEGAFDARLYDLRVANDEVVVVLVPVAVLS